MKTFFAIGIGGFFGAISRYYLSVLLPNNANFPTTTLVINLVGCFCLAFLFTTFTNRTPFVLCLGTGFLGAFTTFSTFSVETLLLIENNQWGQALSYCFISVIGGLICAWLGAFLSRGRVQ
ncbi:MULTISPECIES: fluoride efflux transporter CrcB [unclassified Lysinibacillus]|uniref:fluoride efflux transporter CrcB n=1 Tax=unclassified Lysinibacillus TaxID=2636778 RepID=UPI00117495DF|nr:fluoride efflux transporter CrcB [Lysinibacillus sp. CD3-6]QPQ35405.1 fluoride efflux transporter CrcB [Lysinibacillus sp. JNUCC-52]UED78561.1 fluoride efflux transporter CrcB [Lysinibacillus sp. CD3-6]